MNEIISSYIAIKVISFKETEEIFNKYVYIILIECFFEILTSINIVV